jgi:WD40 repeat protein
MPDQPVNPPESPVNRRNVAIYALLCVFAIAGTVGYALFSRSQSSGGAAGSGSGHTNALTLAEVCRRPHLLFRNTALGPIYGRLTAAPLEAVDGPRFATPLPCDRVYAASEAGVCLQATRKVLTTYQCVSFDRNFELRHTFSLVGVPSRTRVSRDSRKAAVTVFVTGDSYSSAGFSTRTTIFDLQTGAVVGDLEQFTVRKDGELFKSVDFNFWGVTFAPDGDRFYATLSTGGKVFLVEGRVSSREISVLKEGGECPSLSPDGHRLVFKSRTTETGRLIWRLRVLDLKSRTETLVSETRSVDDQAEWLDDEQVLYALPRAVAGSGSSDVWLARADGTGTPRLFVADATSPCVVRP